MRRKCGAAKQFKPGTPPEMVTIEEPTLKCVWPFPAGAQYHPIKRGKWMQETLEGRLKWERTPGGILVSIPVRRGASTVGYVLLVLIWITIASVHYWHLFTQPRLDSPEAMYQLIAIGIYVLGFFF